MRRALLIFCLFLFLICFAESREEPFILDRVSQTYLPSRYNSYGAKFCLGEASAEKVAHDPRQQILYIAGHDLVHLLDIDYPQAPIILGHIEVPGEVTDVAVCDGLVALSIASKDEVENGRVQILATYKRRKERVQPVELLFDVTVGVLPDMLLFTKDCKSVIVANEGSPGRDKSGQIRNPEGTISLIDVEALFESDGDEQESVKTIDFRDWDSKSEQLSQKGVRWGQKSDHVFSADAEPEYLALSQDQKTLYVNLQENNAIATIDLRKRKVVDIQSLGLKPFGIKRNGLDASDQDNKSELRDWPVFALYQPDTILTFNHRNEEYLVTANEGETAWFDQESGKMWSDAVYGTSVVQNVDDLSNELKEALSNPSELGRLAFSSLKSENNTLVAFGGRSFSIFRARDMKLIFDSGDELEFLQSELFPWAFNAENPEQFCANQGPLSQDINMDTRRHFRWMERGSLSQNKPPPPKSLLMEEAKLQEILKDAREQLGEYEAVERPWDDGLWRPSNALTKLPEELIDMTSRESGLSPESLELAQIGGRRLLFVGNEKGNTIFVYDATNPKKLTWHSALYPGEYNATFAELFTRKRIVDIDPEGMRFISVDQSPRSEPLLVVAGSLSGTVSIYRVVKLPSKYKASAQKGYSRKDVGVLIPTNDPIVTLYVNPELF